MSRDNLKDRINSLASHILFDYNKKECGVDPINHHFFDVWYGEKTFTAQSIDEVMNTPFFDGKALNEIFDEIVITEW